MASDTLQQTLQENLITLLCWDDQHGKIVANILDPNLTEGDFRVITERAIEYWRQYGEAPKEHTIDLVSEIVEDANNRKGKTYRRILSQMEHLASAVNTKYVMTQLRQFIRMQRLKDAILKSAEKLNSQQQLAIGEVEEIWNDMLHKREVDFERGMSLLDVDRYFDFLDNHYKEFMTGVEEFDEAMIVPAREAVILFLAPTGKGKSWWLVNLGKHAAMQRKKVLHVSLEMGEEEVVQRYYQALFSVSKRDKPVKVSQLKFAQDGRMDEIASRKLQQDFHLSSEIAREELKSRLDWRGAVFDNIVVKRFPGRSLTMNGLRAYLDALEADGFTPDLLILDYIGITKTNEKDHRISLGRNFEEFRAICVERNMAGATASQTSKASASVKLVSTTHVAEDWSLIATADVAITYSQTKQEEKLGLARLWVAKARTEEDKFGVIITQSYPVGQFCLESAILEDDYYELVGMDDDEDPPDND